MRRNELIKYIKRFLSKNLIFIVGIKTGGVINGKLIKKFTLMTLTLAGTNFCGFCEFSSILRK